MKTIFRSIGLAMLAALFIAASSGTSFAQAGCDDVDGMTALDAKIRENYPKVTTREVAFDSGKQYLEKYGTCEVAAEFVSWLKVQMPKWEKSIADRKAAEKTGELFKRFDGGIASSNLDEVYASGKALLAIQPENVNVMIPMGLLGVGEAAKKNNKYVDDTLTYAKMAMAKIKGGTPGKMNNGQPVLNKAGKPAYSTWDFSKEEAIDELTNSIAYLTYYAKSDRKGALPLYYELSQSAGRFKNEPSVYGTIGDYYVAEAGKLGTEIAAMIAKQKAMATDEEKEKIDVEIKAKVGLFNGYSERAIDAFARAHKVATDATRKAELLKIVQDLYKRRFDKEAGMDAYIAATTAKPFPNPTSEVAPINDPEPVTTTTSSVGAASGNGIGAASGNGVGAASGNGVGAASGRSVVNTSVPKPVATQATKKP